MDPYLLTSGVFAALFFFQLGRLTGEPRSRPSREKRHGVSRFTISSGMTADDKSVLCLSIRETCDDPFELSVFMGERDAVETAVAMSRAVADVWPDREREPGVST